MEVPVTKSCRNIEHVTVYKRAPVRKSIVLAIAVLLYALVLPYVWNTMGEPRRRAILEAEAIESKKLQEEDQWLEETAGEVEISWDEDDDDDQPLFEDSDEEATSSSSEKNNETDDDVDDEEDARPLPNPYLPDAGAAASLFLLVTGTILFNLLCHWFVWFHAWVYFEPSQKVEVGSHLHILPYAYRGRPELVEVKRDPTSGKLVFEFQRQDFELISELALEEVKLMGLSKTNERVDHDDEDLLIQKMSDAERRECDNKTKAAMAATGVFRPVVCRVDHPVKFFVASRGLKSQKQVEEQKTRYGVNSLQVEPKTMPMLVKEQLLSPLAMFQFFSAALWLMDEYWQYTIFNLFSIVMMEGMTAFQRFRTLKTLKGLAPKPYELPVYRENKWSMRKTTDLLPGDLISLSSSAHQVAPDANAAKKNGANKKAPSKAGKRGTDAVPCDCLILHGSAVVNEATLTGESVPQMKDALKSTSHSDPNTPLDIQGRDRVHVLFSGTTLVSATPGAAKEDNFPVPPDGGCLAYVLRTGFGSSQGELIQMIEFSTESVSSDSRETGIALLVLLCFAMCSSAYVFKHGMEKGDRTTHELLLKCVIILTSVVPRQLPIQMALAVNHALMTLVKEGIFCTEPYRVPYSGKITHCLFDKTGTLTTDELVPVGIVNPDSDIANMTTTTPAKDILVDIKNAGTSASMVIGACHSLVALPNPDPNEKQELLGDPIELSALKSLGWKFQPKTEIAAPGDLETLQSGFAAVEKKIQESRKQQKELQRQNKTKEVEGVTKSIGELEKQLVALQKSLQDVKKAAEASPIQQIKILHRFHFSSKLQRMSVVCKLRERGKDGFNSTPLVLVKGSPEAVGKLLIEKPSWYRTAYRTLAEQGMRVLALATKPCSPATIVSKLSRDEAEGGLEFAGFIAFECKIRSDSAVVIKSLREADHRVAMATGDAPLTALHVARITNICGDPSTIDNAPLLLSIKEDGVEVEWVGAVGAEEDCIHIPFSPEEIPKLARRHDLLTTEEALMAAVAASQGKVWRFVDYIQVFARMSPQGKAKVIRMIQQFQEDESSTEGFSKQTKFVAMCGDGGNDVGALKQADVGLALLSGYGNANTDDTLDPEAVPDSLNAEDMLNEQAKEMKIRQKAMVKEKKAEFETKRKELVSKQKEMVEEEVNKAYARGETGMWVQLNAVKAVSLRVRDELAKENDRLNRKYNVNLAKKQKGGDGEMDPTEMALEALDDPNALPVVRPGDASVAAPFTSRIPSIRSVIQLVRQGRCTLLSALMQQQIMMLECTISAYCLAALSLEGARSSERQMMASSWLILTASLAFSYSTPIEKMHPVRPIRSLFHPAIFISILGQAAIHLFCMVTAVNLAKGVMGEAKLKEVVAFNRRVSRGLEKKMEEEPEGLDAVAEMLMMWSTPFMPNLMNTVIFLVENSQIMAVLFVNYKGQPWMLGILENHALFLSLFICIAGLCFATFEISPEVNKLIHLHPFPDDEFRFKIIGLVLMTLFGTFIWDRLVTAIFAPRIFKAMVEQAKKTSIEDILPIFNTLMKVVIGFAVFGSGNPIIWAGAYWMYRKYKTKQEEEELQQLQLKQQQQKTIAGK